LTSHRTLPVVTNTHSAPRRPRAPWIAATIATALVIGGAGAAYVATRDGDSPRTEPAAAEGSASPTPSPSAPAPTTIAAPDSHPLGEKVSVADGLARATVLAYRQPVAKGAPRPDDQSGYVWGAAQIQVCAGGQTPIGVSATPWRLVYADGAMVEPSYVTYVQFPRPEYPAVEVVLKAGRCAKGWITFPVSADAKPQFVEYHPAGAPLPIDWRLS
jgi:hypothetical protein